MFSRHTLMHEAHPEYCPCTDEEKAAACVVCETPQCTDEECAAFIKEVKEEAGVLK